MTETTAERYARLWPALNEEQRAEAEILLAKPTRLWEPNPGAQTMVRDSLADLIFWGGQAGGGKSYGSLCIAATQHQTAVIFRRELEDLRGPEGLIETSKRILRPFGHYNANERQWRLEFGGLTRFIEFAGCQREDDKFSQQGRARDLYVFDEVTQFPRTIPTYITAWNRSRDPRQRCRRIYTGNPPSTAEGQWVVQAFAPWIDKRHPNPAAAGELRWFVTDAEGRDLEVKGPGDYITVRGERIDPESRTFVPSVLAENPTYATGDYARRLNLLPEPLRSQLRSGDFMAAITDDAWQVIPSAWLQAAFDRWKATGGKAPAVPLDVCGLDLARGGPAKTVLTKRRRTWFHPQIVRPGAETPDGEAVARLLEENLRGLEKRTPINADVIGVGASGYDSARKAGFRARGINVGDATDETARNRITGFANVRAFMYWSVREALDPEHGDGLAIPEDPELFADLTAHRWIPSGSRIRLEPKEAVEKRLGRSVDKGESLALCYAVPLLRLVTEDAGASLAPPPVFGGDDAGY